MLQYFWIPFFALMIGLFAGYEIGRSDRKMHKSLNDAIEAALEINQEETNKPPGTEGIV